MQKTDECHHGDSWVKREISHMRDHWFSCLLGCIVVHIGMDGMEWLWSKITE